MTNQNSIIEPRNTESTANDPNDDSAHQLHLGYQRVQAEIEQLPPDDVGPVNLDAGAVVQGVLGRLPGLLALRSALAALGTFDLRNIDHLRDYALALGHLHNLHRIANGTPSTVLLKELFATRERLHADAHSLVLRGLLDPARVNQLKSGNHHQGLAFDVIGLVELFLERWEQFDGRLLLQRSELERARLLGNRLISALGAREEGPSATAELSVLRQKAFALLMRAYEEVRHGVAFVRRHQGDVDDIAPSLYAGRIKRSARSNTPEENEPDQNTPSESADARQEVANAEGLNAVVARALAVSHGTFGTAPGSGLAGAAVQGAAQAGGIIPVGFPGAPPLGKE